MSASATQATPPNDSGLPPAGTHRHSQALDDLVDMGTGIARLLYDQAVTQAAQQVSAPAPQAAPAQQAMPAQQATPAPAPVPSATPGTLNKTATAFDQIARAVRRCIALAQDLNAPKHHPAKPSAQHPAPDRTAARKRIIRAIEDTIQRPSDNPECDGPEILLPEFRERMDGPDMDADISTRPVEDIIKEICRDLGLAALPGTHPWKRRTPADIAELNARAAAPSGPAPSADRQASAEPQDGTPAVVQRPSDPEPDSRADQPAATDRPQPATFHAGNILPADPAELVAFVLHHHARTDVRWRSPEG